MFPRLTAVVRAKAGRDLEIQCEVGSGEFVAAQVVADILRETGKRTAAQCRSVKSDVEKRAVVRERQSSSGLLPAKGDDVIEAEARLITEMLLPLVSADPGTDI